MTWVQDLTLWTILIQKKLSIPPNCFIALKSISQGSFEKLFNKNRGIGEMSIHWQFKAWNYAVVVIIYVTVLLNIFSSLGLMVRLHRRETDKFRNTMQKIPPNSSSCLAPGIVATKIIEGFEEGLFKEYTKGREPVSTVHYTRPGTCVNHPLH